MPRVTPADAIPDNPRARFAETARRATLRAAQEANRRRAMPRWAGPAMRIGRTAAPLLLLAAVGAWAWASGQAAMLTSTVTDRFMHASVDAGLSVGEVFVQGRKRTAKTDMLAALGVQRGSPILAFDPHAARLALEQIPWVAEARVERRLPDTIFIAIKERKPMALWQHDRQLRLVDADGVVLTDEDLSRWPNLPMLVGADAPARGPELLRRLAAEPTIGERVEAAILVAGRRWDLKLKNGVDVRLPEHEVPEALHQLALIQQTNQILDKDVVAIDLRMPDRLAIQTSAMAADQRRKPPEKKQKI
ncbi:FtsQ-type POTRA domain-containing protein [Niveispirillum sp. SYP-B3756]|uniref:cell division protein FtsQ/DivIB n=1 Tax=Niveispirillum sp. SYP-B3756 TaxID=2662178 RepID=UPI00129247FD|nr:cell division protein FtsQ/DivIB [Niveispirillum sp. SYP-B3756]MQP67119.1 FtsQ-type POTRA domain-containing protein [Niveispirillum sp. SYP-B3756]